MRRKSSDQIAGLVTSTGRRLKEAIIEHERLLPYEAYFTCIAMGEVPIKVSVGEGDEKRTCMVIGLRRSHGGIVIHMNEDERYTYPEFIEKWLSVCGSKTGLPARIQRLADAVAKLQRAAFETRG